ncbi:helix-turn-helix domain-containing protein [Alcaligenes faecalis]|uniref:helix-turn-helix domain-containing protein n=1 Tax=Alcaligenes faecalis TaxID=511 RepID=UPI001EEF7BDD|nr:helix-turn-helix domain-containing protein [Alcaligenes faecalis]ULH08212.1 helix-turn-helix domain-containing protein [Alcaligenes faecalis]
MSVEVMTAVFKRYPVGGGEMILALALADHADDDGAKVFPSIDHLMTKTRQSRRTVQYQLRRMEESGWLILVNSGNGGRGQSREYRISLDWIKGGDLPDQKNGAEIAPIADEKNGADFAPINSHEKGAIHDIKGASDDAKGANDDMKGCNGLHPHITTIEPSNNRHKPSKADALVLPAWLEPDDWARWDRFRKKKSGTGWTEDAVALNLRTLTALKDSGQDPKKVIEQSIERGWTGLFGVKESNSGQGPSAQSGGMNRQEALEARNREIARLAALES